MLRLRYFLGTWLLAVVACTSPHGAPGVLSLQQGWLLIDATLTSPPAADDPRWVPVSLPDAWRGERAYHGGLGWYRFHVPAPGETSQRWALYLPAANMTADAYVNGHSVGSGGRLTPPVSRNFSSPLYFVFPSSLLDKVDNRIDIVLGAVPYNQAMLDRVWLGPDDALRPSYNVDDVLRGTLPWSETLLSFLMAGLMAALWLSSRERVYGTFSLVGLFYGISSLNYWVHNPPLDFWTWERVIHSALFAFVVALAIWARQFLALRSVQRERALVATGAVAITIMALLPTPVFLSSVVWLHCLTFSIAAYACGSILMNIRRLGQGERVIYIVGSVVSLAVGAHDVVLNLGVLPPGARYLMPHEAPLFVLTFGVSLLRRFAHSLREAEDLGRTLERRVEERRVQIEESYRKLRQLEHDKLLSAERDRMIREMHDGLGSQLTSALALIERGVDVPPHLSVTLRGALDEMRLVIGSLDSEPREVSEVLGVLRPRLQPILDAAGITLEWRMEVAQELRPFGPEESLHILRIVQEAIANVIKHARASRVTVRTGLVEGTARILVSVSDNGQGFDPTGGGAGRGLSHMKRRAQALGGHLEVESGSAGTRLTLVIPTAAQPDEPRPHPGAGA
ncbi:MAG: sensor histidine kinase [Myxococcota bacterium]